MRSRLQTLRGRLVAWSVVSTTASLLVFGATTFAVILVQESNEHEERAGMPDPESDHEEPPPYEASRQLLVAFLLAGPFGVAFGASGAILLARWGLSGLDAITRTAAVIGARDLAARIPVPSTPLEVRDLAISLNQLLERLEQGYASLARFAADASHELRTPLAVLRNDLEVGRRKERTDDEWRAIARRADAEIVRLSRLLDALLLLARAETIRESGDPEASLDEVVADVVRLADSIAATRRIRLECDGEKGIRVRIDSEPLRSALTNLVTNAIRHSPEGGSVFIRIQRAFGGVVLHVDDEGRGVPRELRQEIFQPFRRGPDQKDEGLGLGLTIAARMVERYGGAITATDRTDGAGARFVVTLRSAG